LALKLRRRERASQLFFASNDAFNAANGGRATTLNKRPQSSSDLPARLEQRLSGGGVIVYLSYSRSLSRRAGNQQRNGAYR
jgi:outer membrane usher protein FimD/PapC